MWKREDKKPLGSPKIDGIVTLKWVLNTKEELGIVYCFSRQAEGLGPCISTFKKLSGSIRFDEYIPLDGFTRKK